MVLRWFDRSSAQQANYVIDHLGEVCDEMPNMTINGHQIKHLVVAESQQAVYDLGEKLKSLAAKKRIKSNVGGNIKIGVFFSGRVKTSDGKMLRDREANGKISDQEMLKKADIIVCCQKFLAGWDEWRVSSDRIPNCTHTRRDAQEL